MPEWSKGVDLRPTIVRFARSNRARCKTSCIWVKYTIFSHSVVVITPDFDHVNIYMEAHLETRIRIPVGDIY